MKKIIGASLALLTLASCGAPKIESPADALKQNQTAIIENLETIQKMTPDQAKSVWVVSFGVEAKEGKVDGSMKYDFKANQVTYETAGNLALDFNVETKVEWISPVWDISGDLDLDLITLKNKFLFKLNALNLNDVEENPQLAFVTGMVAPFQNKWFFVDMPEGAGAAFNQELLTKQKEIVALAKKHSILAHVATNENADFYDYDVELNEESVINFLTELETLGQKEESKEVADMATEEITESMLSETEIADIRATVQNFNKEIKGNIKINKSNLEYFTLTFSHSDGGFTLENTETALNMIVTDTVEKAEISYKAIKSATKLDGTISAMQDAKELLNGTLVIESDGTTTDVAFNATAKDEFSGEEFKINLHIADTTTAEDVVIEEPTDAADFQEAVAQIMGGMMGAPVQMEDDLDQSFDIEVNEPQNIEQIVQ